MHPLNKWSTVCNPKLLYLSSVEERTEIKFESVSLKMKNNY